MANVGWRTIYKLGVQVPGSITNKTDRILQMPTGGWAQVRSADDPQSLRGEGLDFVVLDECAFMREESWSEALRPALSDRQGQAMFISTPKGRNWFWHLWQRGQDGGEWQSWQRPTGENPFIAETEIQAAQHDLPERIFAQEYMANFLDDAGGVFRKVMDAARAMPAKPEPGAQYVMGVDWGRYEDFTVISILDMAKHEMVAMDRFNQIDYGFQTRRLKALAERYNPTTIIAEKNSMGDPLVTQLQKDGLPVWGFTTTNATKARIIEDLSLAFERSDLAILNDPILIGELQAYEMERLPSGLVRYGAPPGMHDDAVMSLALAWYACASNAYRPAVSYQG